MYTFKLTSSFQGTSKEGIVELLTLARGVNPDEKSTLLISDQTGTPICTMEAKIELILQFMKQSTHFENQQS